MSQFQPYDPAAHLTPPRTSGMAIAGFVTSFLCGLLGIILSAVALSEIGKSQGRLTGEGLAIAGIVIGVVTILGALVINLGGA